MTTLTTAAARRARAFSHSKGGEAKFERRGLRGYFEYRDLGVEKASEGKVVAHVIRARPGKAPEGEWHRHDCKVQFVYVLKGWIRFEYEGVGEVIMKKGDCFQQPPNIAHREISHSKDIEMLEVVAPADFATKEARAIAPKARAVALALKTRSARRQR
ncbi:MAG: cupin domain-containing protein [Burkholderiales bacterium]